MTVKTIDQIVDIIRETVENVLKENNVGYESTTITSIIDEPDIKSITVRINKLDLNSAFFTINEIIDQIHSILQEDKLKDVGEVLISYENDIQLVDDNKSNNNSVLFSSLGAKADIELSFHIV